MTSKQIVARLMKKCGFVQGKEGGTSAYLELGILTFRISNHKTHLWTWEYNYGSRLPKSMVSLVFEDSSTVSQPILKKPIGNSFTVNEWTYQSSDLSISEVDSIANEINAYKRQYQCPIGKGNYVPVTSINPTIDVESAQWNASMSKIDYLGTLWGNVYKSAKDAEKDIRLFIQKHPAIPNSSIPIYCVVYNCPDTPREVIAKFAQCSRKVASKMGITTATPLLESKIYKNMKNNVKRINESQLRAIVAESVKKVLNEGRGRFAAIKQAISVLRPFENDEYIEDILDLLYNEANKEAWADDGLGITAESIKRTLRESLEGQTAFYKGRKYTIDDELPYNAKVSIRYPDSMYAYGAYPNKGESLRDWLESRGESINDVAEWWMD